MTRNRRIAAALACVTGVTTVISTFIIAKVMGRYMGGLAWPFISDLGRDPPGSAVFFFGLNGVAVLVGLTWAFNHQYQYRVLQSTLGHDQVSSFVCSLSYASCFFGVVGAFGLTLFAARDLSPAVRSDAALELLLCEAIAMFITTYLNYRIVMIKREELESGVFVTIRHAPRSVAVEKVMALRAVKCAFMVELTCAALFVVSVLVYLPVLYDPVPVDHLSINDCLLKGLGETYCTVTMRMNGFNTTLWDYENALAVNQVRALAQLGCVVTLLGYTMSFVAGATDEDEQSERDRMFHSALSKGSPIIGSSPTHHGARRARSRSRSSSPGSPRRCLSPKSGGRSGPPSYISV